MLASNDRAGGRLCRRPLVMALVELGARDISHERRWPSIDPVRPNLLAAGGQVRRRQLIGLHLRAAQLCLGRIHLRVGGPLRALCARRCRSPPEVRAPAFRLSSVPIGWRGHKVDRLTDEKFAFGWPHSGKLRTKPNYCIYCSQCLARVRSGQMTTLCRGHNSFGPS